MSAEGCLPVAIVVLAHNEERRIGVCLGSLPLSDAGFAIHVAVNGSQDRTAEIVADVAAHHSNVTLHNWPEGGKARSWNRMLLDVLAPGHPAVVLVDGDAEVVSGSIRALVACLAAHPSANLAAAPPANGRRHAQYRAEMAANHGVFGDLYALRGTWLDRMRTRGIRLPVDLVGDDGLIGALVKTDLGPLADWQDARVQPALDAGFLCEPVSLMRPQSWRLQYRRMVSYSVRHFQNEIVTSILREQEPTDLPERLALLYPAHLPRFTPRRALSAWWFDRQALARMAEASC
jgi:glycosyltransferase involved in cell wall biosynthesis